MRCSVPGSSARSALSTGRDRRASHYFAARLPEQFDLIVHVDRTRALEPLERWGRHETTCPKPIRQECEVGPVFTPRSVRIRAGQALIEGDLVVPERPAGLVVFAHGSGSSRFSRRNRSVAQGLEDGGFATLLLDLLTREEERLKRARPSIDMTCWARVVAAIDWAPPPSRAWRIWRRMLRRQHRGGGGGRPDLAGDALPNVEAPTLLIVGGADGPVIELNRAAMRRMHGDVELEIVPGATHLFEEPGALESVSQLALQWCVRHLGPTPG